MNVDQQATSAIRDLHRQIVKDLIQIEDEILDLTERRDQMRSVVKNLEALYSGLEEYSESGNGEDSPRGQEAVERVLMERANEWLSIKDITSEMEFKRWIDRKAKNPEAAVRAALRRLIDSESDAIEQRKEGRSVLYRLRQLHQASLSDAE